MNTKMTRLVPPIMDSRVKTVHECSVLFSLLCVMILQMIACLSQTWYVLSIDINKCLNCGRIIVTMGSLIEQNIEMREDERYSKGFSLDYAINRRDYHNTVYNTDSEHIDHDSYQSQGEGGRNDTVQSAAYTEGGRGDTVQSAAYTEVFRIENVIHVYVGIRGTSLCTDNIMYCVDLDTEVAHNVFSSIRPLKQIQESVELIRLFMLISVAATMLTSVYTLLVSTPHTCMSTIIGGSVSAVTSLAAVARASLPFCWTSGMFAVIKLCVPWALLLTLLSAYITLVTVYNTWRRLTIKCQTSLQNWHVRHFNVV